MLESCCCQKEVLLSIQYEALFESVVGSSDAFYLLTYSDVPCLNPADVNRQFYCPSSVMQYVKVLWVLVMHSSYLLTQMFRV